MTWLGDPIDVEGIALRCRAWAPGDRAYIATRWVTSYDTERAGISRDDYRARQARIVDHVLDSRQTVAVVVCSESTPTALHAWAVASLAGPLHYAFCDPKLRRRGLAKAAITTALGSYPTRIDCTHSWPHRSGRFLWNWYRAGASLALDT
jgi:hypothetical protein